MNHATADFLASEANTGPAAIAELVAIARAAGIAATAPRSPQAVRELGEAIRATVHQRAKGLAYAGLEAGRHAAPEPTACDRCGEIGHDRRTLVHACNADMMHIGVPFRRGPEDFHELRVCKDCRGAWMQAIAAWFCDGNPAIVDARDGRR